MARVIFLAMSNPLSQRPITFIVDSISAGAIVGTIMGYLPAIAALAAVIWYVIQIYESKTIQKMLRLKRLRSRVKRTAYRNAIIGDHDAKDR